MIQNINNSSFLQNYKHFQLIFRVISFKVFDTDPRQLSMSFKYTPKVIQSFTNFSYSPESSAIPKK